ncbi:MAG: hypothetical protein KDD94_13630 [Calditrichaeota bacterium]|nr:hypothetical protein [Calditrichota bacterium]
MYLAFSHLFILILLVACAQDTAVDNQTTEQETSKRDPFEPQFGDGFPYDGEKLIYTASWPSNWVVGHDGKPYISDRVKIYSNYASTNVRKQIAEAAESTIDSIFKFIEMDKSNFYSFQFHPDYTAGRIHIHADHNENPNSWGLAYRDGILIKSLEAPVYVNNPIFPRERWDLILNHELYHVFEFLLIANPLYQQGNSVWMREGGANYGAKHNKTQTLKALQDWQTLMADIPGQGNPIAIQVWNDFPAVIIGDKRTGEYYEFFELGVRYLLDPVGLGKTMTDLKQHYTNLGNGMSFANSFQSVFGISISYYQANYFDLMTAYLQNPDRQMGSSRYGKTD